MSVDAEGSTMLTSDLLRVTKRKGAIKPRYLDVDDATARQRAQALVAIFEEHRDKPRGIIEDKVERAIGHGTDFLIWRGLAKLLYDRSEFCVDAPHKPEEIRQKVFDLAQAAGNPSDREPRAEVLAAAGQHFDLSAEACERALYADLEERQVLCEFKSIEPLDLLHRYNLALAQAVLYRARGLQIDVDTPDANELRLLFQMLKFHRLMHRTTRDGDRFSITVDGPASLLKRGRKYGVEMAKFLPSLLHLKSWSMSATIEWEDREFEFVVGHQEGLQPHTKARGQWVAEEERWFEERFEDQAPSGWALERRGEVVDLGDNEVLVTDYVVSTDDGDEVWVEIVGFWRLGYLRRRLDRLANLKGAPPVVLVVSERLKTDRDKLADSPAGLVFFKGVILVNKVVDAARQVLAADG